jgi:hypothetical protein
MFPKKPVNIITDCDEILTNISPLWVKKIHDDKSGFFEKYFNRKETFDHNNPEDIKFVLSRNEFHLNKWMLKKDLKLTDEETKLLFEKFYALYDNDEFYEECVPTQMCEGIYKMSQQRFVNKIYVVTRTSEGTKEGKRRFIETFIPSDKVEIIFVGRNEKKSDYIKELDNVALIMEDELSNIHDIVDNCKHLSEVDLYIPYTGYNKPDADFFDKMNENKFKAIYYPVFEEVQA